MTNENRLCLDGGRRAHISVQVVSGAAKAVRESPKSSKVFQGSKLAKLAIALFVLGTAVLRAQQDDHKRKLPVLDKLTTTNGQDAFSGAVKSLDMKTSLLLVQSTRDNTDEYFPVKKNVHVATADGQRVPLDRLKPGVSVLIYYEEKGDRRAIKEIVVLGGPPSSTKDKPSPPS